jgi:hypothetical protein
MKREASPVRGRVLSDRALVTHIRAVHRQTRGRYGRPHLLRALRNQSIPVGKQRRHKLMQPDAVRETLAESTGQNMSFVMGCEIQGQGQ